MPVTTFVPTKLVLEHADPTSGDLRPLLMQWRLGSQYDPQPQSLTFFDHDGRTTLQVDGIVVDRAALLAWFVAARSPEVTVVTDPAQFGIVVVADFREAA